MSRARDHLDAVEAEFGTAFDGLDDAGRRELLKVMGASLALAGLAGCSDQPDTHAIPWIRQPEFTVPGVARHYATAVTTVGGYAQPVLGTTHEGRPTKLEGLPGHPASGGRADAFTQAAILGLYDPSRSQAPRHGGEPTDWGGFDAAMIANARVLDARRGAGLRILTGQSTSPTLARQLGEIAARWPGARWHVFEPAGEDGRVAASRLAFGRPLDVRPRLDRASIVVSLDDDLLGPGPRQTLHGRLWAQRRQAYQTGRGGSRLFCAEPTPSLTGVVADERLAAAQARIPLLCQALAARFGLAPAATSLTAREAGWIAQAAAALQAARGEALVTVGAHHLPEVQALAWRIDEALGALGRTLELAPPAALITPDGGDLASLVGDMRRGAVDTLLILDSNPVYAAPADLAFAEALAKVRFTVHAGLHADETGRRCAWHAPLEHDLETWSDARAVDGTVSLIQPLVRPFYDVRSRHAVLETLQGRPASGGREAVEATWRKAWGGGFDARWADSLRAGSVADPAPAAAAAAVASTALARPPGPADIEVTFRPDPTVWDGRFATNGALQELPKPLSKLTWGNALLLSPSLARELFVVDGDVVRLHVGGRTLEGPVRVTPGQARRTVTATLGHGRRLPDAVGDGVGYDAGAIRTSAAMWSAPVDKVERVGVKVKLAVTQPVQSQGDDDFVRTIDLAAARAPGPQAPKQRAPEHGPSFYPDKAEDGPQYGMSIDTDLCIGCGACITACDTENNIAIVGPEQVAKGRQMHWMRVDHYADGDEEAPEEAFQPVPCMHCEQAPCEIGCPVNATVHGPDGLNLQVYNRCIGTRTCSSYCPYKVRRFNWFDFTGHDGPEKRAQRNPNVTVRTRGVMEKCTYCVQRISDARITAKKENREVRDGEIVTACQQTCPTEAIVFGDIRDPASAVSRRKAGVRDYSLLEDENTRPRTTYLARIREPKGGRR